MTDLFVACSVRELPKPYVPSTKLYCRDCGNEVWVDNKLVKLVSRAVLLCVGCSAKRLQSGHV